MRKIRAAVYTWADLLNILSEFVVANLNKVKNMFTSRYLIFDLFFFSGKFRMIINIWFKKKSPKAWLWIFIVPRLPVYSVDVMDVYVCILYTKFWLFVFLFLLGTPWVWKAFRVFNKLRYSFMEWLWSYLACSLTAL